MSARASARGNGGHDVFVFPSLFEGFGLVLLEAMAMGLPMITTAHTAGPDLLEDGKEGFIVPIRSAEAIAEKLTWLSAHRETGRREWASGQSSSGQLLHLGRLRSALVGQVARACQDMPHRLIKADERSVSLTTLQAAFPSALSRRTPRSGSRVRLLPNEDIGESNGPYGSYLILLVFEGSLAEVGASRVSRRRC